MLTEALSKQRPFKLITAEVLSADKTSAVLNMTQEPNMGSELSIFVNVGAGGITFDATNKIEGIVEGSDDGTTWHTIPAAQIVGASSSTFMVVDSAADDDAIYEIGILKTYQRYRIRIDFSGTHGTGTPISAWAIIGRLQVSRIID